MRTAFAMTALVAATLTLASPARADVTLSNFTEVTASGSSTTGVCLNESVGFFDQQPRFFDGERHLDTTGRQLAPGKWRAFMGRSTRWRIVKTKNLTDTSQFYFGWVEVQVIRRGPFGAEDVETEFVRGFDSSGSFQWPGFPDDADFGAFVVQPGSIDVYFVRAIVHAGPCSEARVRRLSVDLVGPS
jgi:hypothetical protein